MIGPGDRKNDPRKIIPTLRAGDVITESFLASITQALNERRPVSNPPTQIYRQPASAGVTKAVSWCTIDLAAPTTNENLNGATIFASSDTISSFDGTTNAKKMLFNFEKKVSFSGTKISAFLGLNPGISASTAFSSGAFGVATTVVLGATIRVRPITASFVTASQTWNNFGSLTLGAAVTWSVGTASVGAATTTQISSVTLGSSIKDLWFNPTVSDIYGYAVDIEPLFTQQLNGTFVRSSISASAQVSTGTITPYILIQ